ncbi:MAG TPA: hypothetical protein VF327_02720, partial [Gaiellaceae bacterium]
MVPSRFATEMPAPLVSPVPSPVTVALVVFVAATPTVPGDEIVVVPPIAVIALLVTITLATSASVLADALAPPVATELAFTIEE